MLDYLLRQTLVFLPLTLSSVVDCKKGGRNNSGEKPFAASCQIEVQSGVVGGVLVSRMNERDLKVIVQRHT